MTWFSQTQNLEYKSREDGAPFYLIIYQELFTTSETLHTDGKHHL